MKKNIKVGTTYYPEHWPRERWQKDIQLMKEAGINVLRLAESAWAKLEPRDGKYDFSWLDDFISMISKESIEVILGTPIEASPVWLRHTYPEVVAHDQFGRIHAERGFHCHNNHNFKYYVNRLVNQMAEHYANNPVVVGWQIDNELRSVPCYCSECEDGYRNWLKKKYGTLDNLNRAWGTTFWSQVYNEWVEIKLPTADQLTKSVSQILDYKRFQSDSTVNHLNRQVEIIKKHAPHHLVTHNSLGLYHGLDIYKLSEDLDFLSLDMYPDVDADNTWTCLNLDIHRSAKKDNVWVMEQKNGYFNYSNYNLAIEPGLVRLWALQDIARGSNAVLFYRWRSNGYSWEQNPNGILRHDGSPRRAFDEIKQLTNELEDFSTSIANTKVKAPVAILHSYDHIWSFEAHTQYRSFDYRKHIVSYYKALLQMGITPDLVDPLMDISDYQIVIAPSLTMVNDEIYANLKSYTENGGHLILGARSGFKTWENTTIDTPWPGLLTELTGVSVDEFEVLPDRCTNTITYNNKEYEVKVWLDMLELNTAKSLATYTKKFYAGRTAISKNQYKNGIVYFVGVMGNDSLMKDLLKDVANECGLAYTSLPDGVYRTCRQNEECKFYFYVNMNNEPKELTLPEVGTDILTGERITGKVTLDALDALIIQ
ncbi:beta-galactosidase [Gracilibacillus sp. D59]|uniref:beta-galactosidase n=1 Tax=Gracilibacillus sp. D59 TaxID=3457434 RepID=UPI003FCC43C3